MTRNIRKRLARLLGLTQALMTRTGRPLSAVVSASFICGALVTPAGDAQTTPAVGQPVQSPGSGNQHQLSPPARHALKQQQQPGLKTLIPDVELVDQDGRRIRFYSDLIEGKVFVVSFVFTTCNFVCPMQGESLSKIQTALGARLGRDVSLISISTDPSRDTPERLKDWGARFGAKPGWTLVTGRGEDIGKLVEAFTGSATYRGEHSPVVFVGSDRKGTWVRAYGLSGPTVTAKLIEEMAGGQMAEQLR